MERLLKYIRETNEKRKELEIKHAEIKSQLETQIQQTYMKFKQSDHCSYEKYSEESIDNLKVILRELEKRLTQQDLNYEDALLELEALNKHNKKQNIDVNRNSSKDDLGWILDLMSNYSIEKDISNSSASRLVEHSFEYLKIKEEVSNYLSSTDVNDWNDNMSSRECLPAFTLANNMKETMLNEISPVNEGTSERERKYIPVPIAIQIESHPNQPNSKCIKWQSHDTDMEIDGCPISSYHIYIDGDFYKAVAVNENLSAVLPNLDNKSHRVSVRSVCSNGQSKDQQCTLEINSNNPAPSILKANKITSTSANVSWMPSNSTMCHEIWVNGVKFCDCPPGVYKISLHGLEADSLQKVRVYPVLDQYPDTTAISSYLEFQTLPVGTEGKISITIKSPVVEIDPPSDVKLKLGNRPGRFYVRWMCPERVSYPTIKLLGYSIFINNQCIALVNGALNDRFRLNLKDLREIRLSVQQKLQDANEELYLPLTVRTLGTVTERDTLVDCTVTSTDSLPSFKFSGKVAIRIAGSVAEASTMLGENLAYFFNLIHSKNVSNDKTSWHSCYCLNDTDDHKEAVSFLPRSNIDWMENKSISNRSISICHRKKSDDEISSLSDDSGQDYSDSREILPEISNELFENSNSTDSSTNSQYYQTNLKQQTTNIRRRSMIDNLSHDSEFENVHRVVSRTPKTSTSSKGNRADTSQMKISVPKIEITKETSFSEDEEGHTMIRKVDCQIIDDLYKDRFQLREHLNEYQEFTNNFDNSSGNKSDVTEMKTYFSNPTDQFQEVSQLKNDNCRYFITLYNYEPETMSPNRDAINEELPFKAGDCIKIFGEIDEDGFYTGEIRGQQGLVPSNMVQEIDDFHSTNKYRPVNNNNDGYDNISPIKDKDVVYSRNKQLKGYSGRKSLDYQQTYSQNQYIKMQDPYNNHQVYHRKSTDSVISYAASDHTSYENSKRVKDLERQRNSGVNSICRSMIALYDYDPHILSPNVDSDVELAFKANDVIIILSEIDYDGFYFGERNGRRGLVPSNFLIDAVPHSTKLENHQSYDDVQNSFKERKVSSNSNNSDHPIVRDTRSKATTLVSDRKIARNSRPSLEDITYDMNFKSGSQKDEKTNGIEECFNNSPPHMSDNPPKIESVPSSYLQDTERRASLKKETRIKNPIENEPFRPVVNEKQLTRRSSKSSKEPRLRQGNSTHCPQSTTIASQRRPSPPTQFEPDDMPIVMDLAPAKSNQKKKKSSSGTDSGRPNLIDNQEVYGSGDNLYANSSPSTSDHVERKRSVFKNPFKKKKF